MLDYLYQINCFKCDILFGTRFFLIAWVMSKMKPSLLYFGIHISKLIFPNLMIVRIIVSATIQNKFVLSCPARWAWQENIIHSERHHQTCNKMILGLNVKRQGNSWLCEDANLITGWHFFLIRTLQRMSTMKRILELKLKYEGFHRGWKWYETIFFMTDCRAFRHATKC